MAAGRLAGLGAIVTGALGGIGQVIGQCFAAEGAQVVGLDRAAPGSAQDDGFIACDVADAASLEAAFATALDRLGGRLDILVTAAALTGGRGAFPDVTDAEWNGYIGTNLTGTFHACRAAARAMIARGEGGSIVTLGSINSLAAEAGASPYASSKGGVAMLTKAMAVDLARHRIRANMLAPGPTEVPRNAELFAQPAFVRYFAEAIPAGVAAQPQDVANAALFFAEPASHMITGTTLVVDGGMMARIPVVSGE